MRAMMLAAAAVAALMCGAGPAFADKDRHNDRDRHHNRSDDRRDGRDHDWGGHDWRGRSLSYRDGHCTITRQVGKRGQYKEQINCQPDRRPPPQIVIVQPSRPHDRGWELPTRGVVLPRGDILQCNRETLGAVLGGAAGGLIGSAIGRGDGRIAAAIGGTIAGVLFGGSIGRDMDRVDHNCFAWALDGAENDRIVEWRNPNGNEYELRPIRSFGDQAGRQCREYLATATVAGRPQQIYGTACREPDGAWRLVS